MYIIYLMVFRIMGLLNLLLLIKIKYIQVFICVCKLLQSMAHEPQQPL